MCGIAGIFSSKPESPIFPKRALDVMAHRGPDDSGIFQDLHVALGHRRLSIFDISQRGHQPMNLKGSPFTIVFNGEIYNFLELKSELESLGCHFHTGTDTEVLLAAYQYWGVECLQRLRGMFAFAIWDSEKQTLFLARDRFGEKPLYLSRFNDKVVFASELKPMATILPEVPRLSAKAIDLYLHYQFFPEPLTPLENVEKLPAAHYLLLSPDSPYADPQAYWSIDSIPSLEGNPSEIVRESFKEAVAMMLRADVPVGVALSGGIDSGAIASLAAPQYYESMKAFSVGYPGRPPYDERNEALALANELGLQFFDVELKTEEFIDFFPELIQIMDTPIADIAAFGHYYVNRAAANNGIKVLLTGIGGDELFWGYAWPPHAVRLTKLKQKYCKSPLRMIPVSATSRAARFINKLSATSKVPKCINNLAEKLHDIVQMQLEYSDEAVFYGLIGDFSDAQAITPSLYSPDLAAEIPERNSTLPYRVDLQEETNIPHLICRLLFDGWLVSNCLALGDRVSMGCSVEARIPFLDHILVEKVVGLRRNIDDHDLGNKTWLKEALKGILSDEVLNRPKRGFQPPVHEWMEGVIERYGSNLLSGKLVERGFKKDALVNLLDTYQSNWAACFMLYKILVLEKWCTMFFKEASETER